MIHDQNNSGGARLPLSAAHPNSVYDAMKSFMISGYVTTSAVNAVLDRHAKSGRRGVAALRDAVDRSTFDTSPPDSELEFAMSDLLCRFRLPTATFYARLLGFEVDFLIDGAPVVIECDGWESHGRDPEQFERDRERDARLQGAGYVVLRFTWNQVARRPQWVASRLVEAITRWAPHLLVVDRCGTCD